MADLNAVQSIAITPDGGYIIAAALDNDALAILQRNTSTGAITQVGAARNNANGVTGLDAVDESGRVLGRIVDLFGAGGNDVIVVSVPGGEELLIPANRESVLRREEGRWVVRPPQFPDEADGEEAPDAV